MAKKTVAHLTIDFYLRGGVQCWIDLVARHTAEQFRHVVLTPNRLEEYPDTACIVPKFARPERSEPSLRRFLDEGELPEVSHASPFVTNEMIEYVSETLRPEIIIVYGNDSEDLFLPARVMCERSVILLRAQYHEGLPFSWVQKHVDGLILFHDNAVLRGLGKPVLELSRTYDDTVFQTVTPYGERSRNAVAYFGRFHESKGVAALATIVDRLAPRGIELHLYTTPTPAHHEKDIQALLDRHPGKVVRFPWITVPQDLAAANNRYRVVLSPGALYNLANTFGQSNLEAIACGASLVGILNTADHVTFAHARGKYLNLAGKLFHAVADADEMVERTLELLELDENPLGNNEPLLEPFRVSQQRSSIGDFLEGLYESKFASLLPAKGGEVDKSEGRGGVG